MWTWIARATICFIQSGAPTAKGAKLRKMRPGTKHARSNASAAKDFPWCSRYPDCDFYPGIFAGGGEGSDAKDKTEYCANAARNWHQGGRFGVLWRALLPGLQATRRWGKAHAARRADETLDEKCPNSKAACKKHGESGQFIGCTGIEGKYTRTFTLGINCPKSAPKANGAVAAPARRTPSNFLSAAPLPRCDLPRRMNRFPETVSEVRVRNYLRQK